MELDGFGASLVGRAIYIVSDDEHAWIPWEFISGTTYSAKILITGDGPGVRCIEAENSWTIVFRPSSARDWSCIATILRGIGHTILLTFDHHAPSPPSTFITYLDGLLAEGRTVITRVWIGTTLEIPTIPDAILFPPLFDAHRSQSAYEMVQRLPARNGHPTWHAMSAMEWNALIEATTGSNLGLMISDVGETRWSLFWHKLSDSVAESHGLLIKRGLSWMRTGCKIIEKNSTT